MIHCRSLAEVLLLTKQRDPQYAIKTFLSTELPLTKHGAAHRSLFSLSSISSSPLFCTCSHFDRNSSRNSSKFYVLSVVLSQMHLLQNDDNERPWHGFGVHATTPGDRGVWERGKVSVNATVNITKSFSLKCQYYLDARALVIKFHWILVKGLKMVSMFEEILLSCSPLTIKKVAN